MLYILDTDHVSLLQRRNPVVGERVAQIPPDDLAVTVVTFAEQMRGRLAAIHRVRTEDEAVAPFKRLGDALAFYLTVQVLPYEVDAATLFQQLRQQKIRIGTQDLRIAAIALSLGATVVTRNLRDFGRVPGLRLENWST